MNIISYIHPTRTYLPCTGVGRHINNILLGLEYDDDINLELICSKQWIKADGKLDIRSPLREIPLKTFPFPENFSERLWKFAQFPKMDKYLSKQTEWLYAPMETYIPVSYCPVAITIHDVQAFETNLPWSSTLQHRWFRYKWGQWIYKALSNYRVIFTMSEFSKHRMIELLGADASKIVVVGNGVDKPFYDIASTDPVKLERPVNNPYTFIIGGLRLKKGADFVLDVAKGLLDTNSDIQIVVAGDSEPEYIAAAKDLPNVKLLGIVPDNDLPRLMRCASSLLFLSHYEGFGIPAIEAMATGTPSIVSNRASLPEVVGTAGIVVKPEDTAAIVDILIQLEKNSQLRLDYSQRGKKHAKEYTWSRCVDIVQKAFYEYH
ncbi:glycosyltransferase family 4 protein [Dolichospermum sp. ST_sed1]|nr:glycosyltransferase family 4 protein [Dolichospermum sp. ST_sed1]MDD1424258.1 glycosyltransferase family 4 protein [Dolichospermum sp. ST_sed9]MDD1429744.1 glycosyltransferase family 4 protein [Dolichospermum sp. ST_sed6]MDD1440542.1 glycosyltransferase family 4 protein [Dolichospermum sp. ST_sed3]MDD1446098.1 glycosyltransferase family 4 protein [Dolichospermum sp. ST_sed8]MDD1454716.1 glycosyltransferase family 4 protein [Dolichospermum sp. ST_sed7]MDD1459628.1 glycosyltransferase family